MLQDVMALSTKMTTETAFDCKWESRCGLPSAIVLLKNLLLKRKDVKKVEVGWLLINRKHGEHGKAIITRAFVSFSCGATIIGT